MQAERTLAPPMAARQQVASEDASDILWVTYRWMSVGLAITGLVAWLVSRTPAAIDLVMNNQFVFFGLILAQLALVVAFNPIAARASTAVAGVTFFFYAALTGTTFSVLFLIYTSQSIARTFFVTAGAFAGLSLFGALTKRDLSAVGRFAMFAVIGLLVASVVNLFMPSTTLYWVTSLAGVVIFGVLTAADTQSLKNMYASSGGAGNLALRGALKLYLDFINMFVFLLRIQGRRHS